MYLVSINSLYKGLLGLLSCICIFQANAQQTKPVQSIAFYYEHVDSVRELLVYDRVVLTPSAVTKRQLKQLKSGGVESFAYLSVGELHQEHISDKFTPHIVSQNKDWNSAIMDLNAAVWHDYLINKTAEYKAKGFDGVFLDTLDSYKMASSDVNVQKEQQKGLINILNGLNKTLPHLLLNRGFELVSLLNFKPEAVVAESLFKGYHVANNSYVSMNKDGQQWLINRLNEVKDAGIEAIVIDYVDGADREQQRYVAQKIIDIEFTPYVSDGLLKQFGVSTVEPVKRRVLAFYSNKNVLRHESHCTRLLSTIVEYKGYVPECVAIESRRFKTIDVTRYQTIVFWMESELFDSEVLSWIKSWFGQTRVVFLDNLPNDGPFLSMLGVEKNDDFRGSLSIDYKDNNIEQLLPFANASMKDFSAYSLASDDVKSHLVLEDSFGKKGATVFSSSWGGAVLKPTVIQSIDLKQYLWTLEPFKLFDLLLKLPELPVPDLTTESGNRILTAHIDGDGFPSRAWMAGKPFSAKVILDRILKKYTMPHTVSIIEAEISPDGLHPKDSAEMETIAKNTFKLPSVEIASHTYSHPFFWDDRVDLGEKQYGDSLPVPGYKVDYDREIFGSVDYINNRLAPKNKKVKMLLWSGVADPTPELIEKTLKYGLLNVNGGSTFVINGQESVAQVFPHLIWYENAVQVYAPVINENLYTELWTENYSGYARVIETFKLLGYPKRLKPMSIYYHMYSGVYSSSITALEKIYDWVNTQESTPLFLSEYAERARTLYETGIGKPLNKEFDWLVVTTGIKSLRLPNTFKNIDLDKTNVAGWNKGPDGRYVTLTSNRTALHLTEKSPITPYLQSVNGIVNYWTPIKQNNKNNLIKFSLSTYVPLSLTIANGANCRLKNSNIKLKKRIKGRDLYLTYPKSGTFTGSLECK